MSKQEEDLEDVKDDKKKKKDKSVIQTKVVHANFIVKNIIENTILLS